MKHEQTFDREDDQAAEDAAIARARADYAAGRFHQHAVVGDWLKTWGTPDRKPFKEWLAARNG